MLGCVQCPRPVEVVDVLHSSSSHWQKPPLSTWVTLSVPNNHWKSVSVTGINSPYVAFLHMETWRLFFFFPSNTVCVSFAQQSVCIYNTTGSGQGQKHRAAIWRDWLLFQSLLLIHSEIFLLDVLIRHRLGLVRLIFLWGSRESCHLPAHGSFNILLDTISWWASPVFFQNFTSA